MNDYRILVVDDEEDLCEILKFNLENEGYLVDTANSAEEALKTDLTNTISFIGCHDGWDLRFQDGKYAQKNKATATIPIIFITAKDTENDTVTGFNLGADDYISKPFSLREVMVRVKAVLRRTASGNEKELRKQLVYKGLILDNGLLVSSSVVESTTTPSITKIGWLVAFNELIPRIRIEELPPGVPVLACICTPLHAPAILDRWR